VDLSVKTSGAFDITVAALMRVWKFEGDIGAMPTDAAVQTALASVGYKHIVLDQDNTTVQFDAPGLQIDLGAIGKGYAVECAMEIVRDHGVTSGILHAGTSTVYALGAPPESDGWRIAVSLPAPTQVGEQDKVVFLLNDSALSVSAPHGKFFEMDGTKYGHVIDPRSGCAITHHLLAAVATDSATESDALSTALLTLGPSWLSELSKLYPQVQAIAAATNHTGSIWVERLNLRSDEQPVNRVQQLEET
jgi:thiamine biosynthesis lipoprotein